MVQQADLIKECEECHGSCKPIPCSSNPLASEFYCSKCHRSYRMTVEAAKQYLAYEAQAKGK